MVQGERAIAWWVNAGKLAVEQLVVGVRYGRWLEQLRMQCDADVELCWAQGKVAKHRGRTSGAVCARRKTDVGLPLG